MKKILGLAAGLLMTAFTFGQSSVTYTDAAAGITSATEFNFVFSDIHTTDAINAAASYYTSYFDVAVTDAGNAGNNVKISLLEDTAIARRVILRLLVTLEVGTVDMDGVDIDRDDFVLKHIVSE